MTPNRGGTMDRDQLPDRVQAAFERGDPAPSAALVRAVRGPGG